LSVHTAPAPSARAGFFPLDEELELGGGAGNLSPRLHEWLVRLSAWAPFEQACKLLSDFARVQVSETTTRRQAEAAGAAYEMIQMQEVEHIERTLPPSPQGADKQLLSVDGAMVPLLHGQWAEVKTLVLGEVQEPVWEDRTKEWVVRTSNLSYFSRMTDADTFGRLALVEIHERGVERAAEAGQISAVMDGAEWQQGFVDYHCPQAVRVLDFPHAAERLGGIASAVWGEGSALGREWLQQRCHQLKHEGPTPVLEHLRSLRVAHQECQVLATNLAYLEKREAQMQYPRFLKEGWPIGSGVVESANKLVVEARLKGGGMHWGGTHVNPMLGLRTMVCNDRWSRDWPRIALRQRQQARECKAHKQHKHKQESKACNKGKPVQQAINPEREFASIVMHKLKSASAPPPLSTNLSSEPISCPTCPTEAKPPWRPAPDHPWRRSPIGRARFQTAKAS
jgi:hypothetical protein